MPDWDGALGRPHRPIAMAKETKPVKVHPQIRVMRADLKDMIRDEIYGAGLKEVGEINLKGKNVICIPIQDVKKIAKKIAMRATIGH